MAEPSLSASRRALHSWKEIAAFLEVTQRSAQRWEKNSGLPVYRIGTGPRARILAYTDELETWLHSATPEIDAEGPARARRFRSIAATAAITGILVLAGAWIWHWGTHRAAQPESFVFQDSRLRVLDAQGRLCWERTFPPLERSYDVMVRDKVRIADIDGDGRREVLVHLLSRDAPAPRATLLCFEQDGKQRWEYRYDRPKTFAGRVFEPSYRGTLVRLVSARGKHYLAAIANHFIWYPAQVNLLDVKTGARVEEYWHPGSIYLAEVFDIDGDGEDEILFGAINNPGAGLGHAALGILKIPFSRTPVPGVPAEAAFPALTGGGELAYALFPHPDLATAMGRLPGPADLQVDRTHGIRFETALPESGGMVYYLDFPLRVREVRPSDNLAPLHERLFRQNLLDHRLSPAEIAEWSRIAVFPAAPDGNSPQLKRFWRFWRPDLIQQN